MVKAVKARLKQWYDELVKLDMKRWLYKDLD